MWNYIQVEIDEDKRMETLQKLVHEENSEGISPFVFSLISGDVYLVKFVCENLITTLGDDLTDIVIQYLLGKVYVNFRFMFYRGPSFNEMTQPVLNKCENQDMVK
jgi:hypothetical protein